MSDRKEVYRSLPGVDTLLASPGLHHLVQQYGKELLTFTIRQTLEYFRAQIHETKPPPIQDEIIRRVEFTTRLYAERNLRKVFNATGIIIHTNLGRAPFSQEMLNDSFSLLQGYNNLEFNLKTGSRGSRNDHASPILKFLTGAEDVLVVNNAAAAVMLILRTFAKNREVIVSRGELIEIGGSFRIPDIMAASDCKMVEVGTTNKTRLSDYENKISDQTAMLFKAHKSNYTIKGFTEEVSVSVLVKLGKKYKLPVVYDLGSGLLKKIPHPALEQEPDVKEALKSGADLVCFSGDKLLGGPQAGIIAGKKPLVEKLRKEPMLRALRVCKTTLALLETACMYYLNEHELRSNNLVFKTFYRDIHNIRQAAEKLQALLNQNAIDTQIVLNQGQCGGGTLPDAAIESFAVQINCGKSNRESSNYAEQMYFQLLANEKPVLGILKKGKILFDMLAIDERDIDTIAGVIVESHQAVLQKLSH
jgi:L-seryl-tRNA(Ser) seleniumtransferase